jgi:nucleoside-diphosphate-sugar epimerase
MAILITGGAGFIGSELAIRLAESGQDVFIFDPAIDDICKEIHEYDNIVLIKGDIANAASISDLCEKNNVDAIFHLAAILPPLTEQEPYTAFKINVEGTINVLECARKNNIKTVIYPSSATVFGPDRKPPFSEDDLRDPWTVYSSFKLCSEIIGSIFAKKFDVSFRAVRLPVVIGPGRERLLGMTQYPIEMVQKAVKGKPYTAEVSPETQVPIIYIDDAVQVLINLWRIEHVKFEIYNIDGIWVTAKELAEGIKKIIPSAEITFKPAKDVHIQKVVEGLKEKQEESKFPFRGKRLLDEILQEYISREKEIKD